MKRKELKKLLKDPKAVARWDAEFRRELQRLEARDWESLKKWKGPVPAGA